MITHSVCHSHSSPRSLCLVRVPYIRIRTSPSHSRAPRSLALSNVSRQRLSLVSGSLSLSLRSHLSRLSSRALSSRGTSLARHATRLASRISSSASSPSRVSSPSVGSQALVFFTKCTSEEVWKWQIWIWDKSENSLAGSLLFTWPSNYVTNVRKEWLSWW